MDTTKQEEMTRNGAVRIKSNQNQISNPKQEFKLKPVSNALSGYL